METKISFSIISSYIKLAVDIAIHFFIKKVKAESISYLNKNYMTLF